MTLKGNTIYCCKYVIPIRVLIKIYTVFNFFKITFYDYTGKHCFCYINLVMIFVNIDKHSIKNMFVSVTSSFYVTAAY